MGYPDLRDTLATVAERADVVGFDLVEVNPQLDVGTGGTSYLAAHLAHRVPRPIAISRDGPLVATNAPSAARRPAADRLRLAQVSIRSGSTCICTSTCRRRRARGKAEYEIWEYGPDTTSSSRASTATSMTR